MSAFRLASDFNEADCIPERRTGPRSPATRNGNAAREPCYCSTNTGSKPPSQWWGWIQGGRTANATVALGELPYAVVMPW